MERAIGIGGIFLRARDATALRAWYQQHLGIDLEEWGGKVYTGSDGDVTVWSVFESDTDYFGRRDQQAMVNYRVRDVDAMLTQLREAGVDVDSRVEELEFGRFGWGTDPEGNRFELWQPA